MICSNSNCKKEFIPKRSSTKYCTRKCARNTWIRNYRLNNTRNCKLYQKQYQKEYYLKNKDKLNEISKQYALKNREKLKIYLKEYSKNYCLKNPHILNALNAKRKATKLKATPKFADLKKIKEIYRNCPKGYHVDHIVPLSNKLVCGLHVEWNLQYLTASDNRRKSNKLIT